MKRFWLWSVIVIILVIVSIACIWLSPFKKEESFESIPAYQDYLASRGSANIEVKQFASIATVSYASSAGIAKQSILVYKNNQWVELSKSDYKKKGIMNSDGNIVVSMDCIYVESKKMLVTELSITSNQLFGSDKVPPKIRDNRNTNFELVDSAVDTWVTYECSFAVENFDESYVLQIDNLSFDIYNSFD